MMSVFCIVRLMVMLKTVRNMTALRGLAVSLCIIAFIGVKSTVFAITPANTDLEHFLPNHGNSVFNAANLLRKWPAQGPEAHRRHPVAHARRLLGCEKGVGCL